MGIESAVRTQFSELKVLCVYNLQHDDTVYDYSTHALYVTHIA